MYNKISISFGRIDQNDIGNHGALVVKNVSRIRCQIGGSILQLNNGFENTSHLRNGPHLHRGLCKNVLAIIIYVSRYGNNRIHVDRIQIWIFKVIAFSCDRKSSQVSNKVCILNTCR